MFWQIINPAFLKILCSGDWRSPIQLNKGMYQISFFINNWKLVANWHSILCIWMENMIMSRVRICLQIERIPYWSIFSISFCQDQDQDSLLVKRRNDNHSPGPVIRELVPSSHQRSELSNTILCIFSGWDQKIGEGIPIPDSLGEEATFINICTGNESLKCHRVLIPTTPSFGDKVICWYTGFTFKTFI